MIPSEELSKLFAAERLTRAPVDAVEQGVSRLLADLAVQVAPAPVAASAVKVTTMAVSKWILAGFVVGVAGSGVATRAWAPSSTEPIQTTRSIEGKASSTGPTTQMARPMVGAAPLVSAESSAAPAPAPTRARPVGAIESDEPARFDAELRLLTLAKAELDAGRPHLAKIWLAEHRARFPKGVFGSDRDALTVLAQCAERPDESLARNFAAGHAGSPMTERLLRACKSTNDLEIDK
jgi:hypothetical protein